MAVHVVCKDEYLQDYCGGELCKTIISEGVEAIFQVKPPYEIDLSKKIVLFTGDVSECVTKIIATVIVGEEPASYEHSPNQIHINGKCLQIGQSRMLREKLSDVASKLILLHKETTCGSGESKEDSIDSKNILASKRLIERSDLDRECIKNSKIELGHTIDTLTSLNVSHRWMLQNMHDIMQRAFESETILAETLDRKMYYSHADVVIVPDCSFKHDAAFLQERGHDVKVIYVEDKTPSELRSEPLLEIEKQHASEFDWMHIRPDYVLHNNKSLGEDALEDEVEMCLRSIMR